VSTLKVLQQKMDSIQQRQEESERQHKKDERQLKEMASPKEMQDCTLQKLECISTALLHPIPIHHHFHKLIQSTS